MKLHTLKPAKGSRKNRKRLGRGNATGQGSTAGKGTKGQLATSGGGKGPGFEGGQLPLQRRLPRLPGFKNIFKKEYQVVNIETLERFKENSTVNPEVLYESRVIRKKKVPVKILGNGELKKSLTVEAHAFSKTAGKAIEKAGGKANVIVEKKIVDSKQSTAKKTKKIKASAKEKEKITKTSHSEDPDLTSEGEESQDPTLSAQDDKNIKASNQEPDKKNVEKKTNEKEENA